MNKLFIIFLTALANYAASPVPFNPNIRTVVASGGGGSAPTKAYEVIPNRDNASDNPETWSLTLGGTLSSGYITLQLGIYGADTPTTVTFDGVAMTQVAVKVSTGDANLQTYIYGLAVGSKAAGTYTCSVSGLNARKFVGKAIAWNGVNQSSPVGTPASASGNSTTPSISVTSAANELVIDCVAWTAASSITGTVDASQTSLFNDAGGATQVSAAGSSEAGAASVTMNWTLSGTAQWASCGIALKP
jgi:hypothetical protein